MEVAYRKCKKCGHEWRFVRSVMRKNPDCDFQCPACGSNDVQRLCNMAHRLGETPDGYPDDWDDVDKILRFW